MYIIFSDILKLTLDKNTFKMLAMNNCSNAMSCKFANIVSKHQATIITVTYVGNVIWDMNSVSVLFDQAWNVFVCTLVIIF
jgi:hypothetical protein